MTVVRLYYNVTHRDGSITKKYLSATTTTNKKTGEAKLQFTNNKNSAYVFKTVEELTQFHFKFATPVNKLGTKLKLEAEEWDKTFEDEFGVDNLKHEKAEMIELLMNKDRLEADILELVNKLKPLQAIDFRELSPAAQEEAKRAISVLETELELKRESLKQLMEEE